MKHLLLQYINGTMTSLCGLQGGAVDEATGHTMTLRICGISCQDCAGLAGHRGLVDTVQAH